MTINLANVEFENDMFTAELPKGGILVFNKIDEVLAIKDQVPEPVQAINIQVIYSNETNSLYTECTNVIGLKDDIIEIKTAYKEYEGLVLNAENMRFCTVEVAVDENASV